MIRELLKEQLTVDSIFADKNKISSHYCPEKLIYREQQLITLTKNVGVVLKDQRAVNQLIYGKPGSGKTMAVRKVLNGIASLAKENGLNVKALYINARNDNSKHKIIIKIAEHLFAGTLNGFGSNVIYDRIIKSLNKEKTRLVIAIDEIDLVKDLNELVYLLSRSNDELIDSSISIIGISNNLTFKDRLDGRSKSSLGQQEIIFPSYQAFEIQEILNQRVIESFKKNSVSHSAINLASALATKESGDVRFALSLLRQAGELAEEKKKSIVGEEEIKLACDKAKKETLNSLVELLTDNQKVIVNAMTELVLQGNWIRKINGTLDENLLTSGQVFEHYCSVAKKQGIKAISSRWYRASLEDLELLGVISCVLSGRGYRGQTQMIRLNFDAKDLNSLLNK